MKINEKRLIKIWCRLDNRARYLDRLMTNKNISDDMFKVWYLEKDRLDKLRVELMQACGFDDYNEFVSYILDSGIIKWDDNNFMWEVL